MVVIERINLPDIKLPKNSDLRNALLLVLHEDEFVSSKQINERIIQNLNLSEEQINLLHNSSKSSRTELAYRLAWIRTALKKEGLISRHEDGKWSKN
jgi:restriction system protein